MGFKGSYLNVATLVDNVYKVSMPNMTAALGLFAIKFNMTNPTNPYLSLNDSSKPLQYLDGIGLSANEISAGEVRIVINTTSSYLVMSIRGAVINNLVSLVDSHINAGDPHSMYLNNDRATVLINNSINNHITQHHNLVTQSTSGMMSSTDKIKLDSISGSNTGDETPNSIVTKLSTNVIDIGLL